jgi:hypothetical protein
MSGVLDSVRDCAQSHPISVAAGLIIALPGTYLFMTGKSITCAIGRNCADAKLPSSSHMTRITKGLSVYEVPNPLDLQLNFPTSRWTDRPTSAFFVQIVRGTVEHVVVLLTSAGDRLGIDVRRLLEMLESRWAPQFSYSRLASVAVTTALPGAFLLFVRDHPESWAARHQTTIANALHVFALVLVANQRVSVQDLLVAGLVLVSFEALQLGMSEGQVLGREAKDAPAAFETLLNQTHGIVAKSDLSGSPVLRRMRHKDVGVDDRCSVTMAASKDAGSGDAESVHLSQTHAVLAESDSEISNERSISDNNHALDKELARLQQTLTITKTAEKAKEFELKRVQKELQHARNTLNENYAEYANLRDEMKTMKQTLGSDHQAVIYRKDIELFALRKSNEQKETYIKERETKLEDIYRQQKTTLELKDAEIRNLKDRITFLERQQTSRHSAEIKVDSAIDGDTQDAVQVRLLRVKGRSSSEIERVIDEKDTEIATLKIDLAKAMSACEALGKTQDELRRAWDSVFEVQKMLNDERQRHVQTQNKLQEAANHLEEESKSRSMKNSLTALPTIQEQDKNELEAMFNAAQEDNLRLYTVVEALEKRVREANARVFLSEQEAEALTEQLRLEKAINEDMETARPSLVHRVHFQRMEGQLKEIRDELAEKEGEIEALKKTADEKDDKFAQLEKDKDTAATSQSNLREENEQLKKEVKDLEATKEQLMLDHERLAQHRSRQRNSSAEHTSARSSATLFTDAQNQSMAATSDEPLPARPVSIAYTPMHTPTTSIQNTPERHLRDDRQDRNMISNDVPPPELRGVRRKSLTFKGLMKKFVRKDDEADVKDKSAKDQKLAKEEKREKERPKTALMPKDKNALVRPKTAAATPTPTLKAIDIPVPTPKQESSNAAKSKSLDEAKADTPPSKHKVAKSSPPRYYAAHADGRPMTAAPTTGTPNSKPGEKNSSKTKGDAVRPMTAAPTGAGQAASKVGKAKEEADVEKARPKSRGAWAAS